MNGVRCSACACLGFLIILLLEGCGVSQPVRVLSDGETRLTATLGGPIIPFAGIAIPVPYTTFGVLHGLSDEWTVGGSVHTTTALFKSVGLDLLGAGTIVRESGWIPQVTARVQGLFFDDIGRGNSPRFFPLLGIVASYRTGGTVLVYAATDHLYQFNPSLYLFTPSVGAEFPLSTNIRMLTEVKWAAANRDTRHGIFEGAGSISGTGNIGIYTGFQYRLGGGNE